MSIVSKYDPEMIADWSSERRLVEDIAIALLETYDGLEMPDDEHIVYAKSFCKANWHATLKEGLVVKLADGSEFSVIVSRVK